MDPISRPIRADQPVRHPLRRGWVIDHRVRDADAGRGRERSWHALPPSLSVATECPVAARRIPCDIPLSGASVPASLKRIEFEILAAGRSVAGTFPAMPNQHTAFTWDGQDVYGRALQGAQVAFVRIGYVYDGFYQQPTALGQSFAAFSGLPLAGNRTRKEVTFSKEIRTSIGLWDARGQGLGGSNLSVHHAYDPNGRVLDRGDGGKRSPESLGQAIIATAAAVRLAANSVMVARPLSPVSRNPTTLQSGRTAVSSSRIPATGSFGEVGPDGIIASVVGQDAAGIPQGAAVGPDGSFYFADAFSNRVLRRGPDGSVASVAGTGVSGFGGDGSPRPKRC